MVYRYLFHSPSYQMTENELFQSKFPWWTAVSDCCCKITLSTLCFSVAHKDKIQGIERVRSNYTTLTYPVWWWNSQKMLFVWSFHKTTLIKNVINCCHGIIPWSIFLSSHAGNVKTNTVLRVVTQWLICSLCKQNVMQVFVAHSLFWKQRQLWHTHWACWKSF